MCSNNNASIYKIKDLASITKINQITSKPYIKCNFNEPFLQYILVFIKIYQIIVITTKMDFAHQIIA